MGISNLGVEFESYPVSSNTQVMNECSKPLTAGLLLLMISLASGGLQAWRSGLDLREVLSVSPVEQQALAEGVPLLRTDEVRIFAESGSHLFLDARPMAEYDQGHLPGALSLPHEDFENAFVALAPIFTPMDPLVVYCSGPTCDDALLVALRLREAGFVDVSVYLDGWKGWTE
jgi:rhodanese-related sulfurtransferase